MAILNRKKMIEDFRREMYSLYGEPTVTPICRGLQKDQAGTSWCMKIYLDGDRLTTQRVYKTGENCVTYENADDIRREQLRVEKRLKQRRENRQSEAKTRRLERERLERERSSLPVLS